VRAACLNLKYPPHNFEIEIETAIETGVTPESSVFPVPHPPLYLEATMRIT
jgi:hypothetical protein